MESESFKKIFDYIRLPQFDIASDATATFKVDSSCPFFLLFVLLRGFFAHKTVTKREWIINNFSSLVWLSSDWNLSLICLAIQETRFSSLPVAFEMPTLSFNQPKAVQINPNLLSTLLYQSLSLSSSFPFFITVHFPISQLPTSHLNMNSNILLLLQFFWACFNVWYYFLGMYLIWEC